MSESTVRAGWLFLLLAAATASWAAPPPELPDFDPSSLEPAVAAQLGALAEHVASVLAAEPGAAERAAAIGELGRHYLAYDLLEPAEHCLRAAADLAPRDFGWRYHLAYLLQKSGRLREAAAEYERALGIVPEVPPALIRLGEVYQALDQPEAAIDVLERAFERDPSAAAALAVLGEVHLSERRYREAIEHLERALEIEPGADLLYYPLALAYRGLGDEDEARRLLARRGKVGLRPADPMIDGLANLTTGERVHLLRGRRAFGAGRFTEAAAEFERAVEADPESVPGWINLGSARAAGGEVEAAVASFRRAIEIAPGNATARFNLGRLLAAAGRPQEALEELRGAVSYAPRDAAAHFELGEVLARLGRPEEALVHYALAVEASPSSEEPWLGRARALIALERWAEARRILEAAHAELPGSGRIAYALARLLAACPDPAQRDGERALELARRVHAAGPTPSRAELVAEALAETGRCEEAAEWQAEILASFGEEAPEASLRQARTRLEHYRRGAPCRPPLAAGPSQQD